MSVVRLDDYRRGDWVIAKESCRMCGPLRAVCVLPRAANPDALECSVCGHMTAAVSHYLTDSNEWAPRLEPVRK